MQALRSLRALLLLSFLTPIACGSKSGANMCERAPTFDDGRPGACRSARKALVCVRPDGFGCLCASDGEPCPGCGAKERAVCRDECGPDEYAATCGAGNGTPPDGAIVVVYDDPPPTCRLLDLGVGLPSIYCCRCQ